MPPLISAIQHSIFINLRSFWLSHTWAYNSCTGILMEDLPTVSDSDAWVCLAMRGSVWNIKNGLSQESINDIIGICSLHCEWRCCNSQRHWNVSMFLHCLLSRFQMLAPRPWYMGEGWSLDSRSYNCDSCCRSHFDTFSWHFHKLIER